MAFTNDFVLTSGLELGGYIVKVNGVTPTNGQLLIGDTTNGRYSIGQLSATNCLTISTSPGGINVTSNATNANTASTIVSRDASGNFVAGTITANLVGNSSTTTKLATARTINGTSFDGSANISFTTDAVAEGTNNLYFTNARASAAAPVQSVFGRAGNVALISSDVVGALGYNPVNPNIINVPNGLAVLDSSSHIPMANMPPAVVGGMNYQGTWNASANSPTLLSGNGTKGWLYTVSVAGSVTIDGISQWNVGDQIVFNGLNWQKIDGLSSEVITVFGRTGNVVMALNDVVTAIGPQSQGTFLAGPVAGLGATAFRTISPSDLPLGTTSTAGTLQVGSGLTVASGIVSANVQTVAGIAPTAGTTNVPLSYSNITGAAPLASPAFTGTPIAPTPAAGTNTTQIATTAFVQGVFAASPAIGTGTPNSGKFTNLSVTGMVNWSVSTIAAAGTNQAAATPITAIVNIISSGTGGVLLPTLSGGMVYIINSTGSTISVYPPSGGAINWSSTNTPIQVSNQSTIQFVAVNTTWYSLNATYA